MGCTACTAKVKGALEAMPEVASAYPYPYPYPYAYPYPYPFPYP